MDLDAQWQRLTEKFHTLAAPRLGTDGADAVEDACRRLPALADVGELCRLLGRVRQVDSAAGRRA
jgi:hypothetical protein